MTEAPEAFARMHWSAWILLVWVACGAVILMSLLAGTAGAWRMTRRAKRIANGSLCMLLQTLGDGLAVRRTVKLLQTAQATTQ